LLEFYVLNYLKADVVVTPVSSNTALEKSDWFKKSFGQKLDRLS